MKSLKIGALALSVLLSTGVSYAQHEVMLIIETAETPADSTTIAVATVFGQSLRQAAESEYPGDPIAQGVFMRGVVDAFEATSASQTAYHQGAATGAILIQNLQQLQSAGLTIDMTTVGGMMAIVAKGESLGMDFASADAHIQSILNPTITVDPEVQSSFLKNMAKRDNVMTTESGLVFETITAGDGASPQPTDNVLVTYIGRLADGTVFDQSENPVMFNVSQLIPGFTEGLLLMKKGGHYRMYMPASLGYGEQGAGDAVPGGAALDFEVVLIDIIPAQQ